MNVNGDWFRDLQHQPLLVHGQYDPFIVGLVVWRDGAVPDEEVGHHLG